MTAPARLMLVGIGSTVGVTLLFAVSVVLVVVW